MIEPEDRFEEWLTRHQVEPLAPRRAAYERIARSARRRRAGKAVTLAVALSVAVVAVAGTVSRLSALPGPLSPPGPTSTTLEPTTTPQPTTSNTATASPSPARNGPTQQSRCHTVDLRVGRVPAPGGGAAGNLYDWLVFTNTSTRTCTLYGFPGVSYLTGPAGQQVNDAARRSSDTPGRVILNPQRAGHAIVHTAQPGLFPDTCKPVAVAGYRIYPPDETTAVFVAAPAQQCSANGVNVPEISPIQPGTT